MEAAIGERRRQDHGPNLVARARTFNHAEAVHDALAGGGNELAARGATIEAVVAALALAAAPTGAERIFLMKVTRLAFFTAGLEEPLRSHVADLVDAALTADAARRVAVGPPPPGDRLPGWVALAMEATEAAPARPRWAPRPELVGALEAAAGLGDPDHVTLAALATIRGMAELPSSHGAEAEAGYDAVERSAFALCARPAASRAERDDARRLVVVLWFALRRRRPLAAAVLRRKLSLDRARWDGRRAGH